MRNILVSLLLILGLTANFATAEEATVPEFATLFQFSTDEEASVVAAFGAFAQSECRKTLPAAIRVMGEFWNGNEEATHTVIFNFADAEAITKTFGMMSQCRAAADLGAAVNANTTPLAQMLTSTVAAGGDYTKDTVYRIWQMNVSDEAAYLNAYEKLMAAQAKAGVLTGAYGVTRIQGGADENVTHIAYAGAADLNALLANSNPSKAFLAFQKKVAGIRTVYRSNISSVLADL
jgi:hypothetical protein